MNLRVSQLVGEVMVGEAASVRASQVVAETISSETAHLRVSQFVVEVLDPVAIPIRTSQVVTEALVDELPGVRTSQIVAEVLTVPPRRVYLPGFALTASQIGGLDPGPLAVTLFAPGATWTEDTSLLLVWGAVSVVNAKITSLDAGFDSGVFAALPTFGSIYVPFPSQGGGFGASTFGNSPFGGSAPVTAGDGFGVTGFGSSPFGGPSPTNPGGGFGVDAFGSSSFGGPPPPPVATYTFTIAGLDANGNPVMVNGQPVEMTVTVSTGHGFGMGAFGTSPWGM